MLAKERVGSSRGCRTIRDEREQSKANTRGKRECIRGSCEGLSPHEEPRKEVGGEDPLVRSPPFVRRLASSKHLAPALVALHKGRLRRARHSSRERKLRRRRRLAYRERRCSRGRGDDGRFRWAGEGEPTDGGGTRSATARALRVEAQAGGRG